MIYFNRTAGQQNANYVPETLAIAWSGLIPNLHHHVNRDK